MEGFNVMLAIHNVLRWVVVLAAIGAIFGAWHGVITGRKFTRRDRLVGVGFAASMHLQVLLGLILYMQSPIVQAGFDDPGAAMGERTMRYFLVEHISMMILAAVFVQLGSTLSKKVDEDERKHKRAAIWYTIGFVVLMAGLHYVWIERPMLPV